jgi:glycosyltransferase involved in cell wall biosynthesis
MNLSHKEIKGLPAAPLGKSGWPWVSNSAAPELFTENRKQWPKISIVTPSFNQGQFLEETIRSVLLQYYPNLEYIIIDGGSSDDSVDIIKKYEPWITYWVSEKDNGQAHAINKGLDRCSGEIFNWINSDDFLSDGALRTVAENFNNFDALAGVVINFNETEKISAKSCNLTVQKMIKGDPTVIYQQPGTWLRIGNLRKVGPLNEAFHYSFDWLLMIKYLNEYPRVKYISDVLVNFRIHNKSKTVNFGPDFRMERLQISLNLMYSKEFFESYCYEAIECLQRYLWIEEIDRLKVINRSAFVRAKLISFAIFRNFFAYPYRYAFGTIKKLILYW